MCSVVDNEFWREFLELYRKQPSLWKVKSDLYLNKVQKTKSLRLMLYKLQEVNPNATIEDLKKKLKNLRTTYRREANKVEASIRSGAAVDEEYVPSLWYFKELDFLRDQVVQKSPSEIVTPEHHLRKRSSIKIHKEQRTEFLKMACESVRSRETKPMDNLEIFAAGWVAKLRTLDEDQQRYARMAFDQILLQAECKTLSLDSVTHISAATASSPPPHPQPLEELQELKYPQAQQQPLNYPIQIPLQHSFSHSCNRRLHRITGFNHRSCCCHRAL